MKLLKPAHRHKMRRRFVVGLLSLAVAVSTATALMIPAMTLENTGTVLDPLFASDAEATDGEPGARDECEYTHTDDCFEKSPFCSSAEIDLNETGDIQTIPDADPSATDEAEEQVSPKTDPVSEKTDRSEYTTDPEHSDLQLADDVKEEETVIENTVEENAPSPEAEIGPLLSTTSSVTSGASEKMTVSGTVTIDGNAPGSNNLFTFLLVSDSGGTTCLTVQNDADGNIVFDVSDLSNGSYLVKQSPTDAEKLSHTGMVFDESTRTVTISGSSSTSGASWLKNRSLYMATGGAGGGPIKVWNSDNSDFAYAYCLENSKIEPHNYWNNKAQYMAIIPATSLTGYTEVSANINDVKKVIYHYTVNPPQTESEWDDVEKIIANLTSGKTINSIQSTALNECLQETVPSNFVLVLLDPYGNNRSYYSSTSSGSYDGRLQSLITGYLVGDRQASYDTIRFANTTLSSSSVTIHAVKTLDGEAPGADHIFSFELLDESGNVIQTQQNDADGNIVFDPISYGTDDSGTYTYKIREINENADGIIYDENVYAVSVGVEKGASSGQTLPDRYYGIRPSSSSGVWYMSTTPGGTDYTVYCIDATKPSPDTTVSESPYWIAELEPDNDMLRAAVCHTDATTLKGIVIPAYDGWLDSPSLKENLEKILYTITYGDLSYLSTTKKAQLVWWATSGESYISQYNDKSDYVTYKNICLAATVPSGYDLVLFHSSDGVYQPFVTLLKSDTTAVFQPEEVTFANTYELIPTQSKEASVSISAFKTLDGQEPGDHEFRFLLTDEDGTELQTKTNTSDGNIVFDPITFYEAGTYTYLLREINDGQAGISYDTGMRTVTLALTDKDFFDLSADAYYSVQGSDYGYYVSSTVGGTDFPVYGVFVLGSSPSATSGSTTYTVSKDPDSAALASYVYTNRYGDELAEHLRKLLYYFETHSMTSSEKKTYMFAATTPYYTQYDTQLNEIYAQSIPDDYHLVLFIPENYTPKSYTQQQPLLGAYGAKVTFTGGNGMEFNNTSSVPTGYKLPETGGIGTFPVTFIGVFCMAAAAMMYIFSIKIKNGGTRKTDKN